MATTQGDDRVGTAESPEHAGLLEAGTADRFAPGFDDSGADKEVLAAEVWVAHAGRISFKVAGLGVQLVGDFGVGGRNGA